MGEDPRLDAELSPDDFSSPNPDQDAPLLQAQQRSPSRSAKEEAEVTENRAAAEEGGDVQKSLTGSRSGEETTPERNLKQDRREQREDDEAADEGLPPSKGSEDESEEGSEGLKENSDANNNSLGTPKDDQGESIDIAESPPQVSFACCHIKDF